MSNQNIDTPAFPVHMSKDGNSYWFTPGEYFEWLCKESENK